MAIPNIIVQLEAIPSRDFSKGKFLGKGGFGQVYLGNWQATPIAVKELLVQIIDDQFLNMFKNEAQIMAQCKHPNIVQMLGICAEEGKFAILMEYLEKGSLDKFLQRPEDLPWNRRYSIAADIGKGLAYLHGRNIVHRDLKSLNILIAKDDTAKITDFGLAKVRDETKTHLTSQGGSPRWMAPEQISQNASASTKTDIYSMGMVLWEIAARKAPYSNAANEMVVLAWKMNNVSETIPSETPPAFADIIKQCWKDPAQRPKAQNLAEDLVRLTTDPNQPLPVFENNGSYPSNFATLSATTESKEDPYLSNNATLSMPPTPTPDLSSHNLLPDALLDYIYSILENEEVQNMESLRTSLEKQTRKLNSASSLTEQDRQVYRLTQKLFDANKKIRKPVAKDLIELIQGSAQTPPPAVVPVKAPPPPQAALPSIAFGKAEWAKYFGDVGVEPPLPADINAILQSSCPYWPQKKVQETHLLVLVPQTVNGRPLTLKTLGELIPRPLEGTPASYAIFSLGYEAPAAKSHWVLMTRGIVVGSGKKYSDQQAFIKSKASYEVPTVLDATVAILMEHVRTGIKLYGDSPKTFTQCQEKDNTDHHLLVGSFGARGLNVFENNFDDSIINRLHIEIGVGGLRKFIPDNPQPAASQAVPPAEQVESPKPNKAQELPIESRISYPSNTLTLADRPIESIPKAPANKAVLPSIAFGKAEWAKYFGDVGVEPPLPADINAILQSSCPYWPQKKVQETHLLVLVPKTVNGKPLTLKTLGELIEKPLQGTATKYLSFDLGEYTDAPAAKSHWALLTRDVIEGSRDKSYSDQKALIKAPYELPTVLDATVAVLMEHVRTGTKLYSEGPWTYTRCQEKYNKDLQLGVGGFGAAGLSVDYYFDSFYNGVGGLRKFF